MTAASGPHVFTPAQRAAICAEWRRIAAEPAPASPRPYGCLAVITGVVLFFAMPQLGIRLPPPWGTVLLAVIGLLVAGGVFVGVFMGSGRHGRAAMRAGAALEALADGPVDDAMRMHHAVVLLAHAVVSDGPTVSSTVDIAGAGKRLGAHLDYVIAVEDVLAQELGVPRIFREQGV